MSEEKKYKIIIVDDDDFLVDMYTAKFSNSGVETKTFKSGEAFLLKLREREKADLILLDIIMPTISGLEILKIMRQEKLLDEVPVVMLTNQNDEKDMALAKQLGVSGYIVKSAATPSEVVAEALRVIKSH